MLLCAVGGGDASEVAHAAGGGVWGGYGDAVPGGDSSAELTLVTGLAALAALAAATNQGTGFGQLQLCLVYSSTRMGCPAPYLDGWPAPHQRPVGEGSPATFSLC